jgi:hypothetical protein
MLLFASVLAVQACGGDDGDGGGGGTGNQSSAGDGGGGEPPSSGVGGTKSKPGDGGEPGTTMAGAGGDVSEPPVSVPLEPRSGSAVVVDGVVATSKNFRVILTLGEGPGGNTTMKSSQHRVNLGVIGSTQ